MEHLSETNVVKKLGVSSNDLPRIAANIAKFANSRGVQFRKFSGFSYCEKLAPLFKPFPSDRLAYLSSVGAGKSPASGVPE